MPKRRTPLKEGDIFVVPQLDGRWTPAQVLNLMMPNVPSCAFYRTRLAPPFLPPLQLERNDIFSALTVTRDLLDSRRWPIVDAAPVQLERARWPNEQYRSRRWVGSKTYGSGIVEDFLNAFHGLAPWDQYKDPNYFDRLLLSESWKPAKVILKSH